MMRTDLAVPTAESALDSDCKLLKALTSFAPYFPSSNITPPDALDLKNFDTMFTMIIPSRDERVFCLKLS